MDAIKDLVSAMALMVGVLIDCKSMGLEGVASVPKKEFLVGSKNVTAYIEASAASRSQSINFLKVAMIR